MEEMAPKASSGEQPHEEKRETTAPAAEETEDVVAVVEPLGRRISWLLQAAGPHRVNSDLVRYSLQFIAMELASLTLSSPAAPSSSSQQAYVLYRLVDWLVDLKEKAKDIDRGLDQYEQELDHHTLLKGAAQRFCRRQRRGHDSALLGRLFLSMAANLYCVTEHPCSYRFKMNDEDHHPWVSGGSSNNEVAHDDAAAEAAGGLLLVGIEDQAMRVLRWLKLTAADGSAMAVVSIVGPVGVGKTSFAMELRRRIQRQARGHHRIRCSAMAPVSRGPDRNINLLQRIMSGIVEPEQLELLLRSQSSHAKMTLDDHVELLARNISEHLQDKRYFILIDGFEHASDWEKIKGAFPKNKCGSQIFITTRVRSVAQSCCSDDHNVLVHEMKPLNESDSRRLLLEASGAMDGFLHGKSFSHVCEEIVRRCDGIPLLITSMAGWLKEQQQRYSTFYSLQQQQVPQRLKQLEQALAPAYGDLPYQSRLLLLYMSMLPHGYRFAKEQLTWKWTTEGLTGEYGYGLEAYDVACRCFSELADRNFIIRAADCKCHPEIEACLWHVNYYVLHFLESISAEMSFVFTTNTLAASAQGGGGGDDKQRRVPRRLALHHPNPKLARLLQTTDLSQTRSLAVSGRVLDHIPLDMLVNLVVLDFEGWQNLKDDNLLKICTSKLYLLKYLSVKNTQVRRLPAEIKELRCLSTLDISHTQISELPPEVCELEDMLKMDLRNTKIRQLPEQIAGLHCLQDLRTGGGDGITDSNETAAKIPEGIRHVYKLVTLATVDLSECSPSFICALGDLKRLMVLAITWSSHQCTERAYTDALRTAMQHWKRLESLTIHCGLCCSMEFLGSSEMPANKRLEKFKVTRGRFVSVPQWINGLEHLAFLQITVCKLLPRDLQIIRGLCNLRCLVLGLEFVPKGEILIESEGFSELLKFSVDCPVPWLAFRTGAMAKLKYLELKFCSGPANQYTVPSGISSLKRLTDVILHYNQERCTDSSNVKMIVKAVKEEVAKHRNPINLVINGTVHDVQEPDTNMEMPSEIQRETLR